MFSQLKLNNQLLNLDHELKSDHDPNPSSSILDPCSGDGALLDAAYDYLNILNLTNGNTLTHNQLLNQILTQPCFAQ